MSPRTPTMTRPPRRDLSPPELQQLERLVDVTSLQAVLEGLSTIAGLKAEHVREAWGDQALARAWANAEGALGIMSLNPNVSEHQL